MNALRVPFLAVAVASLLAATAGAQTKLYNPIARSFQSQPVNVRPVSMMLQEGEDPAAVEAAEEEANVESPVERSADPVGPEEGADAAADETAAPAEAAAPDQAAAPDEDNGESPRSASDIPIPDEPELPEPELMEQADYPEFGPSGDKGCGDKGCCGKGCDGKGCGCGGLGTFGCLRCAPSKPWTLPQPSCLQRAGIKVGGWIQQGITTNSNSPTDNWNATVALNDRDGEWQASQMWMYLAKPIKQRDCCWQVGGHVDIMYGTDWRYGRFFGLEEKINNDDQFYGWVFPQMYAEIGGHNLSVKMGHMAGPLGYEIVPAVGNFFYSHSYAMNYSEPQLVTGVWADYKIGQNWTVQAGFHRGHFMFEDEDDNLNFMGGIQWASCDNKTSIRYAVSVGNEEGLFGQTWFASSLVFQHQFTERFKYVLQHNLGSIQDINLGPWTDAQWYGLNQYFFYKMSKCLEAGLRVEWFRDDDGIRVAGVGNPLNPLGTSRGWTGGPGWAGDFWGITAGLNWAPHPNVKIRPEVRWDWYDGPDNVFNGGQPRPFDDFTGDDQLTAAFDVIIVF